MTPPAPTLDGLVLCELRDVSKRFALPRGGSVRVLEHVGVAVRDNEILALLGPSGSGKSTILRILTGILPPDEGEVLRRGQRLVGLNPDVAMVFQSFALYPWLTVEDNIAEALRARGLQRDAARAATDRVIHLVGLAGFEEAYPRELSGGMKQRVGIARAIAVEPDVLCMDEPFSQVDALTAETLRGELVRFWAAKEHKPRSIVLVSHDVHEVVTMATRIVILGTRPGRVRDVVDNLLPYPRNPRAPAFQRLVEHIHNAITEAEIPDAPAPPVAAQAWVPVPEATVGEITGLLEVLAKAGGISNAFSLVDRLGREFGRVLAVVKAAELLELVDTPRQDVALTPLGRELLAAGVVERKRILRERVLGLRMFADLVDELGRAGRHALDEYAVLSQLALRLPYEDPERMFATIINWARQADLFDHDPDRKVVFVDQVSD